LLKGFKAFFELFQFFQAALVFEEPYAGSYELIGYRPLEVSSWPSITRWVRSSSSSCRFLVTLEALALPPF
jgi:hypothetical protein